MMNCKRNSVVLFNVISAAKFLLPLSETIPPLILQKPGQTQRHFLRKIAEGFHRNADEDSCADQDVRISADV